MNFPSDYPPRAPDPDPNRFERLFLFLAIMMSVVGLWWIGRFFGLWPAFTS